MKPKRPSLPKPDPGSSIGNANLDGITSMEVAYFQMLQAFRHDLINTLTGLMRNLNEGGGTFNFNLPARRTRVRATHILGTSIKHLVYSKDEAADGEPSIDYIMARELVHDLVLREVCLNDVKKDPSSATPIERLLLNTREKTELLQALLVVLIVNGDVQEAWELGFLFGASSWIKKKQNEIGLMRPGHDKAAWQALKKLKLLTIFAEYITQRKLPTKMALRLDAFGKEAAEASFSRLLKSLEIHSYIPDAPKTGPQTGTGTYYLISSPNAVSGLKPMSSYSFVQTIERDALEGLAPWSSIVPSGNPEMAACEIRKIRDSLGPVYWFLLMQFGMSELESAEDLEVFVHRLHTIGLTLI